MAKKAKASTSTLTMVPPDVDPPVGLPPTETYVPPDVNVVGGDDLDELLGLAADTDKTLSYFQGDPWFDGSGDGPPSPPDAWDHVIEQADDDEVAEQIVASGYDQFADLYAAHTSGYTGLPDWKKKQLDAFAVWATARDNPDLDPPATYDALCTYVDTVNELLDEAGFGDDVSERSALKAEAADWLESLSHDQRRQVAHHAGFQHPILVSGGNPHDTSDKDSLSFWLDPCYSPHTKGKLAVQAAAIKRHSLLKAGSQTDINGVTYAELQADNDAAGMIGGLGQAVATQGTWIADADALAELTESHADVPEHYWHYQHAVKAIRHNWKVATAQPGDGVTQQQLDALLVNIEPQATYHLNKNTHEQIAEITGHDLDTLALATSVEYGVLIDPTASSAEVATVTKAAANRHATVVTMAEQAHVNWSLWLAATTQQADADMINKLVTGWKAVHELNADLHGTKWKFTSTSVDAPPEMPPPTTKLRAWLKKQPLGELRKAATELGMGELASPPSSRADVQNWLIGTCRKDPMLIDKGLNSAQHKHNKPKVPATPTTPTAPTTTATATATATAAAPAAEPAVPKVAKPVVTPGAASKLPQAAGDKIIPPSYGRQIADLMDYALLSKATLADLPARDEQTVKTMTFTPNPSHVVSGASHTVEGFSASDGTAWFGKPHPQSGGAARAEAEATASKIKDMLGVATIPVYHHQIDSAHYALQPKLPSTTNLEGNVTALGQADVDTVVRNHVADWLIGDHDGNEKNWLRTNSGGLVRCDHGQAFKHYGTDDPDPSWNPNGNYGTPVFKQLIAAHKTGGLADDVIITVGPALDVIEHAEKLGSAKWREMLRPVAESGVNSDGVTWVPVMRSRAAERHGIAAGQVTDEQIVEEFLDHADNRRANIRSDMRRIFEESGIDASLLAYSADG